jgi:hypothetical protein
MLFYDLEPLVQHGKKSVIGKFKEPIRKPLGKEAVLELVFSKTLTFNVYIIFFIQTYSFFIGLLL